MSWLDFWPKRKPSKLIEQDVELTVISFEDIPLDASDSFPTSIDVCRWCNGPASPSLDECCVRCLEKVKRRAVMREEAAPNSSRIDFY